MSIHIKNLSKKFSSNKVLNNVNLSIPKGVFGLLGENGAGKTTLIKTIATLLAIEEGMVKVFDYSLPTQEKEVREILGYLPQDFGFFEQLTAYEMMDYIALLKNIKDGKERKEEILHLLDEVNLIEKKDVKIKQLSGGMKQRLGIAQCLLGNPKVLILDEPTVGLDPNERLRFRNIINKLAEDKVIIVSTHIISDISMMCDNLAVINKGSVLYSGSLDNLTEIARGKIYLHTVASDAHIDYLQYEKIISITRKKGMLEIRFISEKVVSDDVYTLVEPTLEDAYFYIMFSKEV